MIKGWKGKELGFKVVEVAKTRGRIPANRRNRGVGAWGDTM